MVMPKISHAIMIQEKREEKKTEKNIKVTKDHCPKIAKSYRNNGLIRNSPLEIWFRLERVGDAASLVPLNLALDVLDLLKLVTQLDDREVDHSRIETEGTADGGLNGTR